MRSGMRFMGRPAAVTVALAVLCVVAVGPARADVLTGGAAKYYHDGSHGTLTFSGGNTWVLTWWDLDLTAFTGALNLAYGDDGSGSGWENFPIQIHAHHTGPGGHLLQAYDKWFIGGPISSHGLNPGDGTNPFDVRVYLTQNGDDTWHIEPYLRLDGGSWTPFWDGPFDSADAFDLTASALWLEFDPSASGTVTYEPPTASGVIVTDPDPLLLYIADPDGTIAVEYLGGGAGLVYGYSLKFSWDHTVATTSPGQVIEGNLLSDAGTTRFFKYTSGTDEITVDCALLGDQDGVTGPGTMFTVGFDAVASGVTDVDVTVIKVRDKDNQPLSGFFEEDGEVQVDVDAPVVSGVAIENLTLGHTNAYIKNTDAAKVTATVTDVGPGTFDATNIEANLLGLGGGDDVNPNPYAGGAAEWTLTLTSVVCTPADGTVWVYVDATDSFGNPAVQGSDDITSDNIAPTKITGFAASPGHNKAELVWDDPAATDAHPYQVMVRSHAWGDYPTYGVGMTPSYPSDEGDGGLVWEGAGASHTATYLADGSERDIYYYGAFASDIVLHYGPDDATAQDRSTNYWLGDVVDDATWGTYDGLVTMYDIDKLAGTYALSPSDPWDQCDVGPTDDYSRVGIPVPDAFIGFEDLMIFAMNFGVVSPLVVPFFGEQEIWPALELALDERSSGDEIEVALVLRGNATEVKGLSATVGFDPSQLAFVQARLSADLSSPLGPVFFWSGSDESTVQVDAAVLGTGVTIGGSGDVAYLTFRPLGEGYTLSIEDAVLRGADNEALDAEIEGVESKPGLPTVFRLAENVPNPFNPVTKIMYEVPHESEVTIRIYDVAGRLVRTLVDDTVNPGRHSEAWNGQDDHGEDVGSGVYFCTMEAPDFHGSRKMLLLK